MEHDQDTSNRTKQLLRQPHRGPLGGVCAGIARYFDVDPTIVRIAAVILAFMGPGVPAYLIAWVFIPADDGRTIAASVSPTAGRHDRGTQVFGITLLVIAGSILWGDWWSPARHVLIPLGLIALGSWLLFRRDEDGPQPVMPPPPAPPSGTTPSAPPSPVVSTVIDASSDEETAEVTEVTDDVTDVLPATDADAGDTGGAEPPGPPVPNGPEAFGTPWADTVIVPRRRRILGPIVFGALLLWAGVGWLAGIELETGLAVALCIVGVGFVLGAFIGGSWALVVPALLIAVALVVSSVVDIPLGGGIGDKTWRVLDIDELSSSYELGIGESTLDLRDLRLAPGQDVEVEVHQGIGEMIVILPLDTTVEVTADVGLGKADVFGQSDEGGGVELERTIRGSRLNGSIELDLELGIGHIEVRQEPSRITDPLPR